MRKWDDMGGLVRKGGKGKTGPESAKARVVGGLEKARSLFNLRLRERR